MKGNRREGRIATAPMTAKHNGCTVHVARAGIRRIISSSGEPSSSSFVPPSLRLLFLVDHGWKRRAVHVFLPKAGEKSETCVVVSLAAPAVVVTTHRRNPYPEFRTKSSWAKTQPPETSQPKYDKGNKIYQGPRREDIKVRPLGNRKVWSAR